MSFIDKDSSCEDEIDLCQSEEDKTQDLLKFTTEANNDTLKVDQIMNDENNENLVQDQPEE